MAQGGKVAGKDYHQISETRRLRRLDNTCQLGNL